MSPNPAIPEIVAACLGATTDPKHLPDVLHDLHEVSEMTTPPCGGPNHQVPNGRLGDSFILETKTLICNASLQYYIFTGTPQKRGVHDRTQHNTTKTRYVRDANGSRRSLASLARNRFEVWWIPAWTQGMVVYTRPLSAAQKGAQKWWGWYKYQTSIQKHQICRNLHDVSSQKKAWSFRVHSFEPLRIFDHLHCGGRCVNRLANGYESELLMLFN